MGFKNINRIILFLTVSIFIICSSASFAQALLVSAREFAEANDISFQWFPIQRMMVMRKGLKSVRITVGDINAVVDGTPTPMGVTPKIENGTLMVSQKALTSFFPKSSPVRQITQDTPSQTQQQPQFQQPVVQTQETSLDSSGTILVAIRHSVRSNHTRVVLEFSNPISFDASMENNIYRLDITDCKNLIPTKREDPKGRDIKKLDINSGPNREGLIFKFELFQTEIKPTVQTIQDPFRLILSFPYPQETENVSTTPPAQETKLPEERVFETPIEQAPDVNISVPLQSLASPDFAGRVIVIDPGHGANDSGFIFETRPKESEINFHIASELKDRLEQAGLIAILTRNENSNPHQSARLKIANKYGTDLFVSIYTGGSNDTNKGGFACYVYNTVPPKSDMQSAYTEWLETRNPDLSKAFAKLIEHRLVTHVSTDSRGLIEMPLLPLQYILPPAVLVEVGMLSDRIGGQNLISANYRKAIAHSIANGIIDFINTISTD